MMKQRTIRTFAIFSLILTMILVSAVPSFADGHGRGHGHGQSHDHSKGKGQEKHKGRHSVTLEFDDVRKEADWAQKYIASLAAKKVFEGYEDGNFRPNKPVTRIEAIVAAVRLMGLREEAEDQDNWDEDIHFDDERHIRKQHSWAIGYVVIAQEEGLLDDLDGKLQPEKAASRLWVTELLVRAMDLEEEALDNMDAKLDFRDRHDVPKDKIGYIHVAVDEGIMTGYQNGKFQPNKPVSRAELAAMLERAEGRVTEEAGDEAARGTVAREVRNDTLVLEQNGQTKRYELDPDAFIYRNGKKVSAEELERGDVVFIRSYDELVIFVEVLVPAEDTDEDDDSFKVTGELQSFVLNSRGQISTLAIRHTIKERKQTSVYEVSSDVNIRGELASIDEGEEIVIYGNGKTITRIVIAD